MIYKNVEFHNAAELTENEDGSISWKRVPSYVQERMEAEYGPGMVVNSTGVEMRFVLKGDKATIRMSTSEGDGFFHVYRGSIQGGWEDHELHKLVNTTPEDYVIEKSANMDHLKTMTEKCGYAWDCEVIRVIFDRGKFKIHSIEGDMEIPRADQKPPKTLLTYGSSITHGSNAIDMSHAWAYMLGHNFQMDVRNLGMAGSCAMEPEMVDYIASEGEKGNWDMATLELGINVLTWEESKIIERVENTLKQIAGRNPEKPIIVISPFYHCGDDFDSEGHAEKWRTLIGEIMSKKEYPNVSYINGLDVLGHMRYMCADEVHPNIYGCQRIADYLTEYIRKNIAERI